MRAHFVVATLALFAACEPDSRIEPAQVNWMEWPAEVSAGTPFTTRLVGWEVSCVEVLKFVTAPSVDQSAVTFEPYFLLGSPRDVCPLDLVRPEGVAALSIVAPFYDVQATVPGLEAQFPRTYEIRAGTNVGTGVLRAALPVRTFGDITVQTAQVENGHINAGGVAFTVRDSIGCVKLYPYALLSPGYVIENPPADTTHWSAFVRGYIYDAPAPVCGESRVFHLVTRE